jgi:hypothetical protein
MAAPGLERLGREAACVPVFSSGGTVSATSREKFEQLNRATGLFFSDYNPTV